MGLRWCNGEKLESGQGKMQTIGWRASGRTGLSHALRQDILRNIFTMPESCWYIIVPVKFIFETKIPHFISMQYMNI